MRILLILLMLLPLAACAQSEVDNPDLRDILLQLAENDRMYRDEIQQLRTQGVRNERKVRELMAEQQAVDEDNQLLLQTIVEQHGWPGKRLVGESASSGVLSILRHADPLYQKRHLPLVKQAAMERDVPARDVAEIEDQLRMREGLPQLYGTVFREEAGETALYPIENPQEVNARRAELGLPPIEQELEERGIAWRPPAGAKITVPEEPVAAPMPGDAPPRTGIEIRVTLPDSSAVEDTTKATNW